MKEKVLKFSLSLLIGAFFLWLAFRHADLQALWRQIKGVSFYWLPFFALAMTFSHYLRAERWRLLFPENGDEPPRSTLFAGVMLGYVVNNLVPRLGEISRPVYVSRNRQISGFNLLGTIVAERFFDLLTMFSLILLTTFLLVSDLNLLQQVFGVQSWGWKHYAMIPVVLIVMAGAMLVGYRIAITLEQKMVIRNPVILRLVGYARSFGEGLISLKRVRHWPKFLAYTAGIWAGYTVMTFLPFYMLSMQNRFGLYASESIVVTVVSSIGVSIPTPAGVGSYHLFIQKTLTQLYGVPQIEALTYATVTHAATVALVFLIGPLALWWDKYQTMKK